VADKPSEQAESYIYIPNTIIFKTSCKNVRAVG
jgi:hypothetical protein